MNKAAEYTYTVPATARGMIFKSITIRELYQADEDMARKAAEAKGKPETVAYELINLSVVAVDGVAVVAPFDGMGTWNLKTRNAAAAAFNTVNGTSATDLDDFLGSAQES